MFEVKLREKRRAEDSRTFGETETWVDKQGKTQEVGKGSRLDVRKWTLIKKELTPPDEGRLERAKKVLATYIFEKIGEKRYRVTNPKHMSTNYITDANDDTCTCKDRTSFNFYCKHLIAIHRIEDEGTTPLLGISTPNIGDSPKSDIS